MEEQTIWQKYLMAYVVPSTLWTRTVKSQTHHTHQEKRVSQWKRVFDRTYATRSNGKPDFVGWTDSYTNIAIPDDEMQEWLDATVQRLITLRPKRLLEIGCGVGLLTQALAPHCERYCGSDFSTTAIKRLQEYISSQPQLSHVELTQCEATNFDDVKPHSFDMVVLNSVIQYFPNIDYLINVLRGAAHSVAPGGHIFVGDVRHLGLLKVLQRSIQFAKASPEATVRWLKQRIALAVEQEAELAIDPRFFMALSQSDLPIVRAEILVKRGHAQNELTRYRYDVILHVGEDSPITSEHEIECQAGGVSINDLLSGLKSHRLPKVRITGIAYGRIARDLALTRTLNDADEKQSIQEIRHQFGALEDIRLDLEAIWQSEDTQSYDVGVDWSAESSNGSFDDTFTNRENYSDLALYPNAADDPMDLTSTPLATDPLAAAQMNKLSLELAEMLLTRLPEALLPVAVIVTRKLPTDS